MPKNFIEAIELDLKEFNKNGQSSEEELQVYCRYLLGEAYTAKGDKDMHISKYISSNNKSAYDMEQEIRNYARTQVRNGHLYIRYEDLINAITPSVVQNFINKNNVNNLQNMSNGQSSFPTHNSDMEDISLINKTILEAIDRANVNYGYKEFLRGEFKKGNIDALDRFISPNLMDKYKKLAGLTPEVSKYEMYDLATIKMMIENVIDGASLNNKQKEHLKSEFRDGNINEIEWFLNRAIDPNLINQYKKLVGSTSFDGGSHSM